jgi:hypothetical protein
VTPWNVVRASRGRNPVAASAGAQPVEQDLPQGEQEVSQNQDLPQGEQEVSQNRGGSQEGEQLPPPPPLGDLA